uniref:Myb/SANT-like DNA-binding domain-containing protein n=1 Tax=Magallana gigas TaxID=29159 RepID=K1S4B9_MAGGI
MDSEFASKKKTHKALWKEISVKLKEIHNFTGDWFQCQSKFNKLTAKYKAVEDANRKSGEKRRSMEFHSEMMEVMGDDPKITPLKTVSVGVGKCVNVVCGEKDDSEKGCEIVKARGEREKKASKRKREDELFELLTEVRDDRRRFQEEQQMMDNFHHNVIVIIIGLIVLKYVQ